MPSPAPPYLKRCLQEFPCLSKEKYGRPFDFGAIERGVKSLRSRRQPLTYEQLKTFEAREHWWFERYWILPPEERIRADLETRVFDFWNLPKNEDAVLRDLLDVFKSIEIVSIILRFVRPDHYGIISPPVERVLDVRRGSDAVETYRNYLEDLRAMREHYGFERVADVDMALWVLHERCFGDLLDPEIKSAYLSDPFILQRRASNIMLSQAKLSHPRLAAALLRSEPDLAAVIASYSLELLVREVARHLGVDSGEFHEVIGKLPNYEGIDDLRKGNWVRLKKIRNDLFHQGYWPSAKEREDLVGEVLKIEALLERVREDRALRRSPPRR